MEDDPWFIERSEAYKPAYTGVLRVINWRMERQRMRSMDVFLKMLLFSSTIYLHNRTVYCCEIYSFGASDGPLALEGHVIKTITKNIVNLCWAECVWLPWCFSLNARQISGGMFKCELNNSSKRAKPTKMVAREGWTYYEMQNVSEANQRLYEFIRKEDLGNGWLLYGNSALKLFQEKKNWTGARSHCQSLGGDLVSINTLRENEFVSEHLVNKQNLTTIANETSILPFPYVHWKLNGDESFVQLLGTPGRAEYAYKDGEKALYLKGQKGYAKLPASPLNPQGFTISLWMFLGGSVQQYLTVLHVFSDARIRIIEIYINNWGCQMFIRVNGIAIGQIRYKPHTWEHFALNWRQSTKTFRFGHQGVWKIKYQAGYPSVDITNKASIYLGTIFPQHLDSHIALHGYIKHFIFTNETTTLPTIMFWNAQGVWIGLSNVENTTSYSWSDGNPVAASFQEFRSRPPMSTRKCVVMGKGGKWMEKRCDLEFQFICKKPAPP